MDALFNSIWVPVIIAAEMAGSFAVGWFARGIRKAPSVSVDAQQLALALAALDRASCSFVESTKEQAARLDDLREQLLAREPGAAASSSDEVVVQAAEWLQRTSEDMRRDFAKLIHEWKAALPDADQSIDATPAFMATPATPIRLIDDLQPDRRAKPREDEKQSRRCAPRHAVQTPVYIAPGGGDVLRKSSFKEVTCKSVSASGFAYHSLEKPRESQLVVALDGLAGERIFSAEVVRVMPQSSRGYIIGCRFIERLTSIEA